MDLVKYYSPLGINVHVFCSTDLLKIPFFLKSERRLARVAPFFNPLYKLGDFKLKSTSPSIYLLEACQELSLKPLGSGRRSIFWSPLRLLKIPTLFSDNRDDKDVGRGNEPSKWALCCLWGYRHGISSAVLILIHLQG